MTDGSIHEGSKQCENTNSLIRRVKTKDIYENLVAVVWKKTIRTC